MGRDGKGWGWMIMDGEGWGVYGEVMGRDEYG